MDVIDILVEDHRHISELLSLMQTGADRIVADKALPRSFFETGVRLARDYADKYHHFKEEYLLFGLLGQKHNGELDAHIERHRNQHEQCRDLLDAMSTALAAYEAGGETARKTVHRNATDYVRTLRSHIRSENEVFFPLAQKALTDDEAVALLAEFRRYEAKVDQGAMARMTDGLRQMRAMV